MAGFAAIISGSLAGDAFKCPRKIVVVGKPSWYAISVMLNGEPESSSLAASICWMLMYVFKCIPVIFEKIPERWRGEY